ncbi:MAG: hypothetical protein AAGH76_00270 [Pseudomonadota bacterium]
MNTSYLTRTAVVVALAALLGACAGGSKMLKEPLPLVEAEVLATQSDESLNATLDWVIVPGGPGTWAKNAYWDQYIIRVAAVGPTPVRVVDVTVVDILGAKHAPLPAREQLVAATKATRKRFKKEGIEPVPGQGIDGISVVAGAAGTVGAAAGLASAGLYSSLGASVGAGAATGMAAAGAIVIGGPILAVGGIVRSGNNRRVNREIVAIQTLLPQTIEPGEPQQLNLFLPVTPAPQTVTIHYSINDGSEQTLTLPVADVLGRLHMPAEEPD